MAHGMVESIKLHQEKLQDICSSPSILKKRLTQICKEQETRTPVWLENALETDRLKDPSKDGRSLE
jgi:hypothetical protein